MCRENQFLSLALRVGTDPAGYGKAIEEDLAYLRAGIGGIFCDQPDVCPQARAELGAGAVTAGGR